MSEVPVGLVAERTDEPPLRLRPALERLEEIRRLLDSDQLELEDQLRLYREGCELAVRARRALDQAVAEIQYLEESAEG